MTLTNKQIKLLGTLAVKPVIAPWSCIDLVKLEQMQLVLGVMALGANGKLHTSKNWTLTDVGCRFVAENAA